MTHAIIQNDMAAARAELRQGQYGQFQNAEELIRAHYESIPPEVRSAMRKSVNEQATATLDPSTIQVPEGGKLLAAVVRGEYVSFVWENADGQMLHGAVEYDPDEHMLSEEEEGATSPAPSSASKEPKNEGSPTKSSGSTAKAASGSRSGSAKKK